MLAGSLMNWVFALFVGLGLRHAGFGINPFEQFGIGVVDELLFGLSVCARFLQRDVSRLRVIGGYYCAPAL